MNFLQTIENEAVLRKVRASDGPIVFVCLGDFRQILPVVPDGNHNDILQACISSTQQWPYFRVLKLTTNMRLTGLDASRLNANSTNEEILDIDRQRAYAKSLLDIGEGRHSEDALVLNEIDFDGCKTQSIGLPTMPSKMEGCVDDAIRFISLSRWIQNKKNKI